MCHSEHHRLNYGADRGCYTSGTISALVNLLQNDELDTMEEAVWEIKRATDITSNDQIKLLVHKYCIRSMYKLLDNTAAEIVILSLQGLENILKARENEKNLGSSGDANVYAQKIEEAEGVRMIESLLEDSRKEIGKMAAKILERYYEEREVVHPLIRGLGEREAGFHFK